MRNDADGLEPHRMVSLIEFLMFDLDADGFVGVEEAVELFYRRYGREVLFKKEGVKGMTSDNATGAGGNLLSFHDFVKHDLAFYSISRQMADRAAYVAAKKREQEATEKAKKANKEEPQPSETNVPGVEGPPSGTSSPRSPRGRSNSIVGGQLHVRLFDADAKGSAMLSSVDESDAGEPTPRSRRGKATKLEQELEAGDTSPKATNNNSLAKFAAMQERASSGARGHLVTRTSSRITDRTAVEAENEQQERIPERITAKEALLKQETLKMRRGSEVIYTFHGLSSATDGVAGQR